MAKSGSVTFSIRKKLFLLTLVAFTLLIVATSWQIGLQANKIANKDLQANLKQARVVLDTKIDSRYLSIAEVANSIARDGRVLPLVFEKESLTLQDLSLEFQRALDFDVIFFTSSDGEILARNDRPEAIGRNLAGRTPLFDQPLAGTPSKGVFISGESLYQIVVVPVFDNIAKDIVRGTVALAYELSPEMATEIQSLTDSDVAFFSFRRNENREVNGVERNHATNESLAEQLEEYLNQKPELWSAIFTSSETTSDTMYDLGDDTYASAIHALANEGGDNLAFVVTMKSREAILAPFYDIQRIVIIIGVICLTVAITFAWFFAIRMSRPIVSLVSMAGSIQDGTYKEKSKKSRISDEIDLLYNAVVAMGNSLQEKAELESYLAQMSAELDYESSGEDVFLESEMLPEEKSGDTTHNLQSASNLDETVVHLTHTMEANATQSTAFDGVVDERYNIVRHVGKGAVGTVFLAHDMALDENVALKMMPMHLFSKQDSLNFKEEIKLARKITHRNVLRTFDFGAWQDYYYITMEYLQGYDLGVLLRNKGAFKSSIGLTMVRQICSAMHAAHEQGIIHRDLKPSNMMINRQGILKIMDFGLAMKVRQPQAPASTDDSDEKTQNVVGTPRYMAPEQFFNWPLDERTDIYAIGAIMYAVFSGKPPFTSSSFETLADLHLNKVPERIVLESGEVSSALQDIIFKALEKKPENRYQSVRALLDDLDSLMGIGQ